jgi:hypothetical protein
LQFVLEVAVPAHCAFRLAVGIHDDLECDAVFPVRLLGYAFSWRAGLLGVHIMIIGVSVESCQGSIGMLLLRVIY